MPSDRRPRSMIRVGFVPFVPDRLNGSISQEVVHPQFEKRDTWMRICLKNLFKKLIEDI